MNYGLKKVTVKLYIVDMDREK